MTPRQVNRRGILAGVICVLVSAVLLFLPVYHFEANVYTKRSGNTFVGDERYLAVRAEVDALAADYRGRGIETEVTEEVTERVNSKGETTSLVVFRINKEIRCSALDFFRTGFPSRGVLAVMLALTAASLAAGIAGFLLAPDKLWRDLRGTAYGLRMLSVLLAVAAAASAVVFVLYTNVIINRQISLYAAGTIPSPGERVLRAADMLIYQGAGGEDTATLLKSTTYRVIPFWWMQVPLLLGLALCMVTVRDGQIAKGLRRGMLYFGVTVMCVLILYPFVVMFVSAFRTDADATDVNFLHMFPAEWMWGNMRHILDRGVIRYLLNSAILAAGATCLALLCGIPAAYAMARMRFRGRKLFMGFVIMSQMFSPVVLLVGISRLMINLQLNDTLTGLIFVNAAFNQAFAIWLLRGTFVSISPEMEQAACIDGCNSVTALIRVLIPMAAPGIVTTLIFVFINSWNEYTISTVLINSDANRPITVGLTQFAAFSMIQWNYLFASSLLATVPVVILFMFIEKHLVSGLTSGGVKG